MTSHGGTVLSTAFINAIFWGPSWANTAFAGDKMVGIDSFDSGFNASSYAATSDEYSGPNGQISSGTTYGGQLIDTSTAANGSKPSVIRDEVAKEITSPVANGFYAVYTDVPRGSAKYCAWHSWGIVSGVTVQFAYFFSFDGDPHSTVSSEAGRTRQCECSRIERGTYRSSWGWLVRQRQPGERRQVRLELRRPVRDAQQRHPVEAAR
jgi:hypothetical protein